MLQTRRREKNWVCCWSKYNTGSLFGGDEVEGNQPGRVVRVAFESGMDSDFD